MLAQDITAVATLISALATLIYVWRIHGQIKTGNGKPIGPYIQKAADTIEAVAENAGVIPPTTPPVPPTLPPDPKP